MAKTKKEQINDAFKPTGAKEKYYYSLGSDLLNTLVGGGMGMGIPAGKIINIIGDKSSGKTFVSCEIVANSFHKDNSIKWVYDDCESGFGFDTETMYGVKVMPDNLNERFRSKTVEELYCNIRSFVEGLNGKKGIYIVDSLDGLSSDELDARADERYKSHKEGKDFEKGSYMMGKAKFLSEEFFRPIAEMIDSSNCLLIIISQIRQNVDPFSFEKNKVAGGKALEFYCHTRLWLYGLSKIERRERAVGYVLRAKTVKSKTKRPFRECMVSLLYDYGLDNVGSNIDYLFDFRTDTGKITKDAMAVWEGKEETVTELTLFAEAMEVDISKLKKQQAIDFLSEKFPKEYDKHFGQKMTRNELIEYVESNKLQKELTKKTLDKWEAIELSIATKRGAREWV